jgi:hypothetical protein
LPLVWAVAVLALLLSASSAVAGTVSDERPLLFTFNGSDTSAGRFEVGAGRPNSIAIDNATGDVYVGSDEFAGNEHAGYVSKFDAEGAAADFATDGASSLFGSVEGAFTNFLGVAVDNSSGPDQGRLYVSQFEDSRLYAFDRSGDEAWSLSPGGGQVEDVTVDASGHPWTVGSFAPPTQYESSSDRPSPTGCSIPGQGGTAIDVDAGGDVYLSAFGVGVKYTNTGGCSFTESVFDPNASDVYVDQSSVDGHVFTAQPGDFEEYDQSGAQLGTFGSSYLSAEGARIAYSPSRDRVYVSQRFERRPVVAVFGPVASGTVPDVTTIEAPSPVGVSTAHFEGAVNPRGVPSTAHFEWKRPEESWAAAEFSPPQTLTANETPQTVEFDAKSLRGNTNYEIRLVAVDSGADKLHAFSNEVKEFTTMEAAAAPEVTIEPPAATASSASVQGTVDPNGDTADWRVQISTDPGCAEGFSDRPLQTLAEGSDAPVSVSYQLTGLLPSQHYCVLITAANSFGSGVSAVEEFETAPVVPSDVEIVPAAPRESTSARLNARVNPQGDALTYRFEYSADGGVTWIPLQAREEASEAREKIVIGEELGGLSPSTTYRYRLGSLEGSAGPATSFGGELEVTTRPAEADDSACPNALVRSEQHGQYLRHCRGFELVNNPDKGTQNALLGESSPSGDKAFWVIPGGAPGSPSGTSSTFRAERTATGWVSAAIAPPAAQQLGGGTWNYLVEGATSDLSTIIAAPSNRNTEESALVRLGPGGTQEVLRHFPSEQRLVPFSGGDFTADAGHVLFINAELEPPQIEEIGHGEPAEVVSIMPDGTQSECGMSRGGGGDNFTGPSGAGSGAGRDWRPGYHRISTVDASRLYFQVQPNGECGSSALALYERNRETGETTLIDPGTPASEPHFIRATPDGRAGYFGTASSLDPADHNQHEDVYRWEEGGQPTCLTCEAVDDANLESDSSIMVSDDFSHVYFTSRSKLDAAATAGNRNIYALSGGAIRFVADLPPESAEDTGLAAAGAELSADGGTLLFPSTPGRTLTADATTAEVELYRYEEADGSLECVSCRHDDVTMHRPQAQFQMSADGSTIAFATEEPLVPGDVDQASDVYEWRDGRASLITDGRSEGARPEVGGVSRDGGDVFFSVVEPGLTGFERDSLRNDYDARIDGGFQPPSPPAHCGDESCQGPLQPPPPVESPTSSSFKGSGNPKNVLRPRCRNGKVRRRDRCVKQRRHRHRHPHTHGEAKRRGK